MDIGARTQPKRLLSQRSAHLREASILRALTLKVTALEDGINRHWRELGDVSAPGPMAARADKLGFAAVPVEYLIVEPVSDTVPVTGAAQPVTVTVPVAQ